MTFSKMQLDALGEATPGQIHVARHPQKPLVLVVLEGTAVILGLTIDQVDVLIDQLTIYRDRIVHEMQPNVPFKSTPIPSAN